MLHHETVHTRAGTPEMSLNTQSSDKNQVGGAHVTRIHNNILLNE